MSYPAHLETRLRAARISLSTGGNPPSLHEAWRALIAAYLMVKGVEPTEAAIASVAAGCDRDAIIVFGVFYSSVEAACRAHGVLSRSVWNRVTRLGETVESAISVLKTLKPREDVIAFGVRYPSRRAACRDHQVHPASANKRMRDQGETFEAAIMALKTLKPKEEVAGFGTSYSSLMAACRAREVSVTSVHRMMLRGETFEAAIAALKTLKPRGVVVFEAPYRSLRAACRAYGVNATSAEKRIKRFGETLEDAISALKARKPREGVIVFGVPFSDLAAVCRAHGVSRRSIDYRVERLGESLEQAILHFLVKCQPVLDEAA